MYIHKRHLKDPYHCLSLIQQTDCLALTAQGAKAQLLDLEGVLREQK